jgi:uncharacterized Zn finger protein
MRGFRPYVPVAQRKAKAQAKLEKLRKKNPSMNPIVIEGSKIATSWWGRAWNRNLESYADYSNRIGRGRSYVKNGLVLDLQITTGSITALVSGSRAAPYKVTVSIDKLSSLSWNRICKEVGRQFEGVGELLAGKFPKSFDEVLCGKQYGLFPAPNNIKFDCSCPDWASMCKHVAATLYGVGARLDQDPALLFQLRGVSMHDLVGTVIQAEQESIIKKARAVKSKKILRGDEDDLSKLFGIDFV